MLAWDPAANAAGYRLYSGTASHVYTQQTEVGNATSTLVSNLINGQTYFFAVTAYNATGVESPASNEISYVGGAPTPTPTVTPTPSPTPSPTPTSTATATPTATATSIQVVVKTNHPGVRFTVDKNVFTSSQTFLWQPGSHHTITTTSPQGAGSGARYVWARWSGGGAMSHTITATQNTTYTATFATQYYLKMRHGINGSVSPPSGWRRKGKTISIYATARNGYLFNRWIGSGSGSFSGRRISASVVMNGPTTETAAFIQSASPTPTPAPSATATATAVPTPTPTPTDTPTPAPTLTAMSTPSATP